MGVEVLVEEPSLTLSSSMATGGSFRPRLLLLGGVAPGDVGMKAELGLPRPNARLKCKPVK